MSSNHSWPAPLAEHYDFLYRLALMQLTHQHDAEDAAQETLLAAAQSWSRYQVDTPLRAWLTGILKHKIIDRLRQRMKERQLFQSCDHDVEMSTTIEQLGFDEHANWLESASIYYRCPQTQLYDKQLLEMVELCMSALPPRGARLLLLREYLGFDTVEITQMMQISAENLRVTLHRMRLQLRQCVVSGWGEL